MHTDEQIRSPKIAVCILTRMREAGLKRALEGVGRQRVPSGLFSRIRVIVVDNDPGGSGQPVCDCLRPTYSWPLEYAVEPIIGIPYARNRALEIAMPEDDLIAFLDDDEVPSETWLAGLLQVLRENKADAVFGPVIPYFPDKVPGWVIRGAFFDREIHPTGTFCTIGATNNVLMSTQMLKQSGIRFNEGYRFSGGSDSVFFECVYQAGYRMIWADEALVTEWIPKSRTTLKWLAMRHFRNGANKSRWLPIWHRLLAVAIGTARVVFGSFCAIIFFPFGRHQSAKAIRWASFGLGLLYGAAGKQFMEYLKVRGV